MLTISSARTCVICREIKCGSVVLIDDRTVCDNCVEEELAIAIGIHAAARSIVTPNKRDLILRMVTSLLNNHGETMPAEARINGRVGALT